MVPQFLMIFRESLEAGLIIGIVAAYLTKVGRPWAKKYLYLGAIAAVALSLAFAAFISTVFGGLEGRTEQIYEGIASLTAAAVLTYMIVWMSRNARTIKGSLERKLAVSLGLDQMFGIFTLAFVSVMREGMETILFLAPLSVSDPLGTLTGIVAGLAAVLLLAALTMGALRKIELSNLFRYTSIGLVVFAAGLAGYGVHELIEAYEDRIPPLLRQEAWKVNPADSGNPFHENGAIGSILKAMVGYDGNPEILRLVVYVAYWIVLGAFVLRCYDRKEGPEQMTHSVCAEGQARP